MNVLAALLGTKTGAHPMKIPIFSVAIIPSLMLFSVAANAVEPPQPKPGLWEVRSQYASDTKGAEGSDVEQQCETRSDQGGSKRVADEDDRRQCSKNETHQEGGKWITNKVCRVGGTTRSFHAVTVSSDKSYRTVTTIISSPPEDGRSRTTTTIDAKWIKTCNAD